MKEIKGIINLILAAIGLAMGVLIKKFYNS